MSPFAINKISNQVFPTIGNPFNELIAIASTNSYAIEKIQANLAVHGLTFFAHSQTAGKGQRGKQWLTEHGSNIIMSSIVDTTSQSINNQFPFSVCVGLGCYDFFSRYAGEETCIKWPNDIYWRDRKAAGILIENTIRGNQWQWAVVGIGMNINQTSFISTLKNPVSLKQITGRSFDAVAMTKELCSFLEVRFNQLKEGKEKEQLEEYNSKLFMINKTVTFKKENISFEATIKGVSKTGQLLIDGYLRDSFSFGEVEWVL